MTNYSKTPKTLNWSTPALYDMGAGLRATTIPQPEIKLLMGDVFVYLNPSLHLSPFTRLWKTVILRETEEEQCVVIFSIFILCLKTYFLESYTGSHVHCCIHLNHFSFLLSIFSSNGLCLPLRQDFFTVAGVAPSWSSDGVNPVPFVNKCFAKTS